MRFRGAGASNPAGGPVFCPTLFRTRRTLSGLEAPPRRDPEGITVLLDLKPFSTFSLQGHERPK